MILTPGANAGFVKSVTALPALPISDNDPDFHMSDGTFMLTEPFQGKMPRHYYTRRKIDGVYKWCELGENATGSIVVAPTVFQNKRITGDTILLRWITAIPPVATGDLNDTKWKYDVVVRKRGIDATDAPNDPNDGEILGYSSVRDQYALKYDLHNETPDPEFGFVCQQDPGDKYIYRIFSVFESGGFAASVPIPSYWTWEEISSLKNAYLRPDNCFKLGDIIEMPRHTDFGILHAQVVDVTTDLSASTKKAWLTFMTMEGIDVGPFDVSEPLTSDYRYADIFGKKIGFGIPEAKLPKGYPSWFRGLLHANAQVKLITSLTGSPVNSASYFFIPSFAEIYGSKPAKGANAFSVDPSAYLNETTNNTNPQFQLFAADKEARIRYDENGDPCSWYLRSADLSVTEGTPKVFYVPDTVPEEDTADAICKTVDVNAEGVRVAPCFKLQFQWSIV